MFKHGSQESLTMWESYLTGLGVSEPARRNHPTPKPGGRAWPRGRVSVVTFLTLANSILTASQWWRLQSQGLADTEL